MKALLQKSIPLICFSILLVAMTSWSATAQECLTCQQEERLLGDRWGLRPHMEEMGIDVGLAYTLDAFSNLRGGLDTSNATRLRRNLDLTVSFDTELLGLWGGGELFIYGQSGQGDGVSEEHVGDLQVISNIDDHDFSQISEVWFHQALFEDQLRFKIGKQDANADFASFGYCANFTNSSFCYPANLLLPTFPDPGLGVAAFVKPCSWFQMGGGLYDGASKGGTSGFDTTFDGKGGSFAIGQIDYLFNAEQEGALSGTYRLGVWRHSANVEEITASPDPKRHSSNYGFYLVADQSLLRTEDELGDASGIAAFFQYSFAPPDRNEIAQYVGGGLSWKGMFSGREKDLSGIGLARAMLSRRIKDLENRTHETTLEIFHMFDILPGLTLQPDLQLVFNPNGDGRNAVVLGSRLIVVF